MDEIRVTGKIEELGGMLPTPIGWDSSCVIRISRADAKRLPLYEQAIITVLGDGAQSLTLTAHDIEMLREGVLITYAGGYRHPDDASKLAAFQHGMKTVCNVLEGMLKKGE